MKKIPVAIIGLGRIASLLEDDPLREKPCTHAGAISANPDCVLSAGFDIDDERRALFAERWNCGGYDDPRRMIEETRPQILHIATHPDSHYQYCALAEEYRIPVAVCEKPLADTLGRAKKIAAIHKRGITRIITNHERRYSSDYIRAKEILESGELGCMLGINAVLFMGKSRRLLDVLWHDGTHIIDIIMFLSGRALGYSGKWGASLKQKTGTCYLAGFLPGGDADIPVMLQLGAGRDHLVFEIEVSLSEGRLRIGNGIFEVWKSHESPYAQGFRSLKKDTGEFEGPTLYFSNMVKDAVACVGDSNRQPESSAVNGLEVIKYLHNVKSWK